MNFADTPQVMERALLELRARGGVWGWPGAVGLICVLAAAVVKLAWLPVLQRESEALSAEAGAIELRLARVAARREPLRRSESTSQQFRDGFPPTKTRQERIAVLLDLAAAHGLASKGTEFRLSSEAELGLLRYSLSMPLVGTYANTRAFIEEAQARDPTLGLDRLRLRRASATATAVDIDIGWSMYMQPETPGVAAPSPESAPR